MIKQKILSFAAEQGIKKCGFSKDSFVALFPYHIENESGNISQYARGKDYHVVVEQKLRPIADKIIELGGIGKIHIDNGLLNDRQAAYQAGLGFYGMNNMLICEEYGSYFFIGQIVHGLNIEPDGPVNRACLRCGKCIEECTGHALGENYFNIDKCQSNISQRKGKLSRSEEELILKSGLCWGCDRCQEVCPFNQGIKNTAIEEFMVDRICCLELKDLENLSNRQFKEKYGSYAFSWRGKNVLIRNLKLLEHVEKCDGEE